MLAHSRASVNEVAEGMNESLADLTEISRRCQAEEWIYRTYMETGK